MTTTQAVDLQYRPRRWQDTVHRSLKRFNVLVCHRRAGKSVLAVLTLIDAALRTAKPNARYAYIAPYWIQAKAIAWSYLREFAGRVPKATFNESELWVEFPNGARIRIYGANNPDALRGLYLDGVVIDEVADIKPDLWGSVIRPALADRKGWAIVLGTPKGVNLLSEIYFAAVKDPDWYAGIYTYRDTDALDPAEIEAMRREMTDNQFRQELLCDFDAAAENQLISMVMVNNACGKHLRDDEYQHAAKVMGVDVARYGGDRSCIWRRQGLATWAPRVFGGDSGNKALNNMELADEVAHHASEWQPDAIFIDAGRGEGVIDRLGQLGFSVIPVDFGGRANNPRFANRRCEMWWAMKEWLEAGGALPDDPIVRMDLCAPTYSYDNNRQVFELESKDDLIKRGLRSPDVGDGLALTHAAPVIPRSFGIGRPAPSAHRVVFDYDPFAERQ
jgi:hypothetical protein